MEGELEIKQNYLRTEILDKGYSADEFLGFIVEKKGEDGANLEIWTLNELKMVVNDFINMYNTLNSPDAKTQIKQESFNRQDSGQPSAKRTSTSEDSFENTNTSNTNFNYIKDENYEEMLQTEKLEMGELSKYPDLKIRINFPEKHAGGFFSKAYVTYLVLTEPLGFRVRRRYSDFEWIIQTLHAIYPGIAVPAIPRKNYGDRFNDVFILKRMRNLEKFLEAMILNPVIKNSPILFDFLSIEKEDDWNNRKKDFAKLRAPTKISEMKTLEGKVHIKISKDDEGKMEVAKSYLNQNETLLKKLSLSYKNLFQEFTQVSLRMKEIADVYSQLFEVSERTDDVIFLFFISFFRI
jgi:hypothetical protein